MQERARSPSPSPRSGDGQPRNPSSLPAAGVRAEQSRPAMLSFFSRTLCFRPPERIVAHACAFAHPSASWSTLCTRPPERIVAHAVHSPTRAYRGARCAFAHPSVSWSHVVLRRPERIGRTSCSLANPSASWPSLNRAHRWNPDQGCHHADAAQPIPLPAPERAGPGLSPR